MSGKGDRYRPLNRDKFNENFERIFGPASTERQRSTSVTSRRGGAVVCPKCGSSEAIKKMGGKVYKRCSYFMEG